MAVCRLQEDGGDGLLIIIDSLDHSKPVGIITYGFLYFTTFVHVHFKIK